MRVRVIFIAVVSLLMWIEQFAFYEREIFDSLVYSLAYRGVEASVCVGLLVFLRRPKRLPQIEWTATAGFSILALAHAFALVVVKESAVVPLTLTGEWAQMVIVFAALLSFRPTLALLTVTWIGGVTATAIRLGRGADLSDHVLLLGIY
ncbi:MAG TPA: hypothetical protein VM580_12280, partial [Labilithrix sp.]|nr:hypothetical protein [Labilithrix sp.]